MPTQVTHYLFKTRNTAGTVPWSYEDAYIDERDAIWRAGDLAKDLHGSRGFMGLEVWKLQARGNLDDAKLVATVQTEVAVTVKMEG